MKIFNIQNIKSNVLANFKFLRQFKFIGFNSAIGQVVKEGEVIASGLGYNVVGDYNIVQFFKDNIINKYLDIIEGEVVYSGQVIAHDNSGIRIRRIRSSVEGIAHIENGHVYIFNGQSNQEERSPIDGTLSDVNVCDFTIKTLSTKISYEFSFGSNILEYALSVISVGLEEDSIVLRLPVSISYKDKCIVMPGILIPSLYEDCVVKGAKSIICGSLRFSDYLYIKNKFPTLPVNVYSVGGVGFTKRVGYLIDIFSKVTKNTFISMGKNYIALNITLNNTIPKPEVWFEVDIGKKVFLDYYPSFNVEGTVVDFLDNKTVLIKTSKNKNIAVDISCLKSIQVC